MEVRNNIGFASDLQISEDAAFWVDGDCLNSNDAPMRLQDGQRLKVHRLEGFNPFADIEQVRGKVCVIIYQADGMRYAVAKEVVGLDEITGSLRLKYYNPEETIVSLKIDTIEGFYLVDGVVELELLPIDFDITLQELTMWHKQWCISRYGSDSLNPERYYNISPDGRYLYEVREGESLNDEKSKCDKVLDLLLRMRLINQKLNGKRLSQHLQWQEREQLEKERETLYKTFLDEVQADIVREQPEPQQIPNELSTPEAKIYLDKAIKLNLIDNGYKWRRNKQLLAYFAEQMSNRLDLSNKLDKDGKQTIAWKPFEILFGKTDLKGAKQNWMRINTKFEPTGFEEIDKIFL